MTARAAGVASGIVSLTTDKFKSVVESFDKTRVAKGSGEKWPHDFPTEAAAQAEAINELKLVLSHREHLARVRHIKADYEKRKAQVEAQLSSAVRTQVDTTRLGLDLISQSVTMTEEVRQNFRHVNDACKHGKELLKDNGEIEDVNCVRTNLVATNSLLETFEKMPARASALIENLKDDDMIIKQTYKDLRKLVRLRDTAYEQGVSFSIEFKQSLKKLDAKLQEATVALQDIIFKNIADLDILAEDNPTVLVRTVEVIEIDDRAKRPLFQGINSAVQEEGKEDFHLEKNEPVKRVSMRERCFQELELVLQETFNEFLADTKEGHTPLASPTAALSPPAPTPAAAAAASPAEPDAPAGKGEKSHSRQPSASDAMAEESKNSTEKSTNKEPSTSKAETKQEETLVEQLEGMLELLNELPELQELVTPCFPDDWKLAEFYESRYRHHVHLAIKWHTREPSRLAKKDLLKAVAFLQNYIKNIAGYYPHAPALPSQITELKQRCEVLIRQFIKSVKGTMLRLINNMVTLELRNPALNEDEDGAFSTTGPRDLFNIVNQQIDIVIEGGVAGQALGDVVFMCAEVFTYHMGALTEYLNSVEMRGDQLVFGPQKDVKDEPFFLAQINNCQQSEDYMNDLKEKIIDFLEEEEERQNEKEESLVSRSEGEGEGGALKARSTVEEVDGEEESLVDRISDQLDDCSGGYFDVAKSCVEVLVLKFMTVIQVNSAQFFTTAWMQHECDPMDQICNSFGEFLDFVQVRKVWKQRITAKILSQIVQDYLHRFVNIKPVVSPELYERLKEDRHTLRKFLENQRELIDEKDAKAEINTLKIVREVVQAEEDFIQVHFEKIINKFGSEAEEVMEGLLAVRSDLSAKMRKELMEAFRAKMPYQQSKTAGGQEAPSNPAERKAGMAKPEGGKGRLWSNFRGKLGSKKAMPKRPGSSVKGGSKPVDGSTTPKLLVRMGSVRSLQPGSRQARGSLPGLAEQ
eukprot:g13927.t1